MPANFTRRLDLFADAGFPDPDAAVRSLSVLAGLVPDGEAIAEADLRASVRNAREKSPLSPGLERLAARVPDWLFEHGGDLTTVLWLAQEEHRDGFALGGFVLAILDALLAKNRAKDALCLFRFLVDVDFDFSRIHAEKGPAYGFFQPRDPNPLVWKLLEHFDSLGAPPALRVLELGCGIGNDALGLLTNPRVASFTGVDISGEALERLAERVHEPGDRVKTIESDFAELLRAPGSVAGVNLVYSYSSLHYFNSSQLTEILRRIHDLLVRNHGHLAFAIKGAGSLWEGQGVPLYRPDVWINWDGQSRWFPSMAAVKKLIEKHGFGPIFHELHEHWGYSVRGKRDFFHYVLATAI